MNRAGRYPERLRGLLDRQAAKEAQLHDLGLARVLQGEQLERRVDRKQVGARLARRDVDRIERNPNRLWTSTSLGASPSRDVHEHPSHHLRRDPEEVPAVLPVDRIPAEQAKAQLVDQARRLKADARSLADQIAGRYAVQLVVYEGQDALERVCIAVAPGAEQLRDLPGVTAIWLLGPCWGPRSSLAEQTIPPGHGRGRATRNEHLSFKAQNASRKCSSPETPSGAVSFGCHCRFERPTTL